MDSFAHKIHNEKKIDYKRKGKLSTYLLRTGLFEIVNIRVPKQICYIRERTNASEDVLLHFQDKYEKQITTVKREKPIPKPTKKKTKANVSTSTTKKQKAKKKKLSTNW